MSFKMEKMLTTKNTTIQKFIGDKKTIVNVTHKEVSAYVTVWQNISDPKKEQGPKHFLYLLKLIDDIRSGDINIISRFSTTKNQKRIASPRMWEAACITLGTLLTVAMYQEFEIETYKKEIRDQFSKLEKDTDKKNSLHCFIEDILDVTYHLYFEKAFRKSPILIQFLVKNCCFLYPETDFELSDNMDVYTKDIFKHFSMKYQFDNFTKESKLNFPLKIFETGEFSYIYLYLIKLLNKEPGLVESTIMNLLLSLKKVKEYQLHVPERAGKCLLAIFFLLKNIINFFSAIKTVILKEL